MKLVLSVFAGFTFCLSAASQCQAGVIASYDVTNSRPNGAGGFGHTYGGAKVLDAGGLYTYSGGSGTLNDGSVGTGTSNSHLFWRTDNSSITLHLDQTYSQLSEIRLYAFVGNNGIPGVISSVDVTFGGVTETIPTEGFGDLNANNNERFHELIRTSGALAAATGSTIQLSNFATSSGSYYTISEVELTFATGSAAPEPTSLAVWSLGLVGLGFARRRRP